MWVGDSNAVHFASATWPRHSLDSSEPGRWVWALGPRLMYSVARDGYPPAMHRRLRLLRRLRNNRDVLWFFSAGEIDLRCHLVPRLKAGADLGYVRIYVERVQNLVAEFDAKHAAVSVPIPPAADMAHTEGFPIVGTLQERLDAHRLMRRRMLEETGPATGATGPVIYAFDATEKISDADGYYRPEVTYDGMHPNDYGRAEIAEVVAEFRRSIESGDGT